MLIRRSIPLPYTAGRAAIDPAAAASSYRCWTNLSNHRILACEDECHSRRGMLLAAGFDDFEMLMEMGQYYYEKAENPRICPWVFAIQQGSIAGRFFEENGEVGLDAVVPPKR
jgi:hypothetical protein